MAPDNVVYLTTAKGKGYVPNPKRSEAQWAGREVAMIESPAHRALSLAALQALYRLEIELSNHAGKDNGKLIVTFDQFADWGVRRPSVASALRELVALGFVAITERGHGGKDGKGAPNKYRLTYKPSHRLAKRERNDSTHEWRRIKTIEEAQAIAAEARKAKDKRYVETATKFISSGTI